MGLVNRVEYILLEKFSEEGLYRFASLPSDETVLYEIPPFNKDDGLFCHRGQTDRLFVARGTMILVCLCDRQEEYVVMSEKKPLLVKIPPRIPHAVMNPTAESCLYLNAVVHHSSPHPRDYQPIQKPYPFDSDRIQKLLQNEASVPD